MDITYIKKIPTHLSIKLSLINKKKNGSRCRRVHGGRGVCISQEQTNTIGWRSTAALER
jgi:hypothetical protein